MGIEGGLESRAVEATMKHGAALTSHDAGDRKREAFRRGVEAMRQAVRVWLRAQANAEAKLFGHSAPPDARRAEKGEAFREAHNAIAALPLPEDRP